MKAVAPSSLKPSFNSTHRKNISSSSNSATFDILSYNDKESNENLNDRPQPLTKDNNDNHSSNNDNSNEKMHRNDKHESNGKTAIQEQIKRLKNATIRMNYLLERTKEAKQVIEEHIKAHTETNGIPNPLRSAYIDKSVLNAPLLNRQPYTLLIPAQSASRPRRSRSKSRSKNDNSSVRSSSADSSRSNRSLRSAYDVYRRYKAPNRPVSAATQKRIQDILKRPSTENRKMRNDDTRKSSPKRIVIQKDNLDNTILQYLIENDDNMDTPILIESLKLKNLKSQLSPTSYKIMTQKVLKPNRQKYGISPSLRPDSSHYKYSAQFDNQYIDWKKSLNK